MAEDAMCLARQTLTTRSEGLNDGGGPVRPQDVGVRPSGLLTQIVLALFIAAFVVSCRNDRESDVLIPDGFHFISKGRVSAGQSDEPYWLIGGEMNYDDAIASLVGDYDERDWTTKFAPEPDSGLLLVNDPGFQICPQYRSFRDERYPLLQRRIAEINKQDPDAVAESTSFRTVMLVYPLRCP